MLLKTRKTIINEVFSRIANDTSRTWYDDSAFPESQSCPVNDTVRFPRGPGDKCYEKGVTAFRLTGADPVFPEAEPADVPQPVIDAFRKSFMDGMRLAFPDEAITAYLTESMMVPAFSNKYGNLAVRYYERVERQFPRVLIQNPNTDERALHLSLEHDINRNAQSDHEDMLSTPRTDRHHLTNTDILRTYRLLAKHPEIVIGFAFWQETIKEYAEELREKLDDAFALAAKDDLDGMEYDFNILNYNPIFSTVFFVRNNITVSTIPLFFISAAIAESQKENTNTDPNDPPSIENFHNGMRQALKKGIFLRQFNSAFGDRQIVCPFGPFGVRWLHATMGNGKTVLENCITKVERERGLNPKVDAMCEGAIQAFTDIIKRSDQDEIKRLDAINKSQTTASSKCPFHQIEMR